MTYKITPSGKILDAQGVEVPRDDREDRWHAYKLWLSAGRTPQPAEEPPAPLEPAEELASAQAWGQALVRGFESAALAPGINADPRAALALDRYLREVSTACTAGRLHVAYAALAELLAEPEAKRPAGAQDEQLVPVYDALAARLSLPIWSKT